MWYIIVCTIKENCTLLFESVFVKSSFSILSGPKNGNKPFFVFAYLDTTYDECFIHIIAPIYSKAVDNDMFQKSQLIVMG